MFLFICFTLFFEIVAACSEFFRCDVLGYWEEEAWITCNASTDYRYLVMLVLAIVFLVVYGIGIPVMFYVLLWRNRSHLWSHQNEFRFGFLMENFKPEFYLFKLVWMSRRFLLALAFSAISSEEWRRFCIIAILLGSLTLQYWVQPFKLPAENALDMLCTLIIVLTFSTITEVFEVSGIYWLLFVCHLGVFLAFILLLAIPLIRSR